MPRRSAWNTYLEPCSKRCVGATVRLACAQKASHQPLVPAQPHSLLVIHWQAFRATARTSWHGKENTKNHTTLGSTISTKVVVDAPASRLPLLGRIQVLQHKQRV